jgi:hypothetical protein
LRCACFRRSRARSRGLTPRLLPIRVYISSRPENHQGGTLSTRQRRYNPVEMSRR